MRRFPVFLRLLKIIAPLAFFAIFAVMQFQHLMSIGNRKVADVPHLVLTDQT